MARKVLLAIRVDAGSHREPTIAELVELNRKNLPGTFEEARLQVTQWSQSADQQYMRVGTHILPGKPFDAFISKCIGELGRNPDVIKATIKGATARQKKSLRPLKSELAVVKKQIKELDSELINCLSVAKAKGAGNFTNTLLKEADELSQTRQAARTSSKGSRMRSS